MQNQNPKWIGKSKTVWGAILIIVMVFADPELFEQIKNFGDNLFQVLPAILSLFGAGVAIWGRIVAKEQVTVKLPE